MEVSQTIIHTGISDAIEMNIEWFKRAKPEPIHVKMIVDFLKLHLENKQKITLEDIMWLHAKYACRRGITSHFWRGKEWTYCQNDEEYFKHYCSVYNSLPWFKMNLGNAILRGKLLVLPIIEIDEPKTLIHE